MSDSINIDKLAPEASLSEILAALVRYRKITMSIVLLCSVLGVLLALILAPVYRATIVVSPAESTMMNDGLGSGIGQLGGLAALAGLRPQQSNNLEAALAILQSRQFARRFIESQDLMPILYAGIWDAEKQDWLVDDREDVPTIQDAIKLLNSSVRRIIRDRDTGLISLRVEWVDPEVAANWANDMISLANQYLRDRAIGGAERSIQYLKEELSKTTSIEVRTSIFGLMEAQIQKIMFAHVQDEYAFNVIDPAYAPEIDDYVRPNRILIVLLGFLAGTLLALFFAGVAAFRGHS